MVGSPLASKKAGIVIMRFQMTRLGALWLWACCLLRCFRLHSIAALGLKNYDFQAGLPIKNVNVGIRGKLPVAAVIAFCSVFARILLVFSSYFARIFRVIPQKSNMTLKFEHPSGIAGGDWGKRCILCQDCFFFARILLEYCRNFARISLSLLEF